MRISTCEFYIREALISLRRNSLMSLVSISTVALSFLILGLFVLFVVNINYLAETFEGQVEIAAFLDPELTTDEIENVKKEISLIPGIMESTFVSKDEALVRLRNQFGEKKDLLDSVEELNPLRHSFEIKAERPEQVSVIAEEVSKCAGIADVRYQREVVERLFSLTRAIRIGGLAIIISLLLATIFLISNTIRLTVFARRQEIGIMKFVGATDWFIRWPFILEGILLGTLGTIVCIICLNRFYYWLAGSVYKTLPFLPLLSPQGLLQPLALLLLGLGLIVGAFGSIVSLHRFLRV